MIIYFNLFSMDFTIFEYFKYVLSRYECIFGIISFIILNIFIKKGERKNDIHV